MFGGLEIKGSTEKKNEEAESSEAPASGFSFLSSTLPAPAGPEPAPEPALAPAPSGFSFLSSSTATASSAQEENDPEETPQENVDGASSTAAASGFSFLSGSGAASTTATSEKVDEVKEEENAAETNVSSGFSFLSSMATQADTPAPAVETSEAKEDEVNAAPATATEPPIGSSSNESMFSMLNLKTAEPSPPTPKRAAATSATSTFSDDILSMANPSQLTGSGVVFGGAAKPRVVKKRVRGKKIGANAAAAVAPIPIATPPTIPAPSAHVTQPEPAEPQAAESNHPVDQPFTQLSNEANEAAIRAEEFITSKQSTSSYTGRYSSTSSIVEDYGDSTANHTDTSIATKKDAKNSEDYMKAKAAAQEAMKTSSAPRKMGFGGGFSGFFKRNLANPSPASSVTEEKPVVAKKVDMTIPVYGESKVPSSVPAFIHGEDDEDTEREPEFEIQRERERAEEEERLQRREEGRLRLEAERENAERQAGEKRKLEEECRIELERSRMEGERMRKEAEEAAKRTPAQMFHNLLEQFAIKSQNATLAVASLRQEKSTMMEKRILLEKQERLATQQIAQAEKQQMDAAEQEDFELADQLAAVIELHEKEQEEKSEILKNIEGLIEDIDYKKLDVGKSVWMCFITIQKELKEFWEEQENSDITDCSDLWEKFESDTKRLAAENERLSADLKNIERDEGFAKEERTELEGKISEETSGIEELRDVASESLNGINEEIEELKRQLETKEMEAAEVKMELHGHDDSIDQVRNKFSRQLTRLKKKESAAEESRKEWEVEEMSYKNAREDHEAEVTAHSEALIAHDEIKDQVKSEIDVAEELAKIIVQEVVVEKSSETGDSNEKLLKVQAEVLNLEAAAEEAKQVLTAAKVSIDTLKEEVSTIEVQLPILESEKKLAAGKRDFKAAAKASKEIKAMLAKKDRCMEELEGEAKDRQVTAQKEVESCVDILAEKKSVAHEQEKKGGIKRMVNLVKQIINLEKLRESVCGTDEEEGHSVKSVGGFVLDSEISALMVEGDELDQKYGGWNDIMLEYASKTELEIAEEVSPEVTVEVQTEQMEQSEDQTENPQTEDNEIDVGVDDDQADDTQDNEKSTAEAMIKYRQMMDELMTLESRLETAIETEDYDEAAEIDDQIAALKYASESLGLMDAEKGIAVNDDENCGLDASEDTRDDEEENSELHVVTGEIAKEIIESKDETNDSAPEEDAVEAVGASDSACTDEEEAFVAEDTQMNGENGNENKNGNVSSLVDDEKKVTEEAQEEIDHTEMPEVEL